MKTEALEVSFSEKIQKYGNSSASPGNAGNSRLQAKGNFGILPFIAQKTSVFEKLAQANRTLFREND